MRAVVDEAGQLHPGADVHLPIDRPELVVDRVARDKEPARRLLVGEALGREVGEPGLGIREAGPTSTDPCASRMILAVFLFCVLNGG